MSVKNEKRVSSKIWKLLKKHGKLVSVVLSVIVIVCIVLIPGGQDQPASIELSEYASINSICELATLRGYYHNVVMYEVEPDGFDKVANDILLWPFGVYTKIGYKQYWLEYSGVVEAGIDASKVKIFPPDADGKVKVYVPDAIILNIYADESSLTAPVSETGLFTSISAREKTMAFSAAQSTMREGASNDSALLTRAKENAKVLLEHYIVAIGKETGEKFSIEWVENP